MSDASVFIPEPDSDGVYRYSDGSGFRFNARVGKWAGWWSPAPNDCCPLRGDNDERSYFATAEEVARAIADGGEGPARDPRAKAGVVDDANYPPTPWAAGAPAEHSGSINITAADGSPVGMVPPAYGYPDREAVARLFAATPELLAACEAILEAVGANGELSRLGPSLLDVRDAAAAAVQKAKGGAQ